MENIKETSEAPGEKQQQLQPEPPLIVFDDDDEDDVDDDEEKDTSQKLVIEEVSAPKETEKIFRKPELVDALITLSDGEEDVTTNEVASEPGKVQKKSSLGAGSVANEEERFRAPKMPLTGYVRYMNDRRDSLRKENPSKTAMEHTRMIAEEWHALPSDVKSNYLKAADVDKQSSSYYQDYKDDEQSDPTYLNESLEVLTNIKTPHGGNISVYLRPTNRILFCSGKYFYIEHTTDQTDHQKECTGIVSTCHTCGVKIKGSLKVNSNFVTHLKTRHPEVYQELLKQKQESGLGNRIKKSDKLQRNILQFLVATNQSLSLAEDVNFLKLFEFMDFPVQLKTPACYEEIIKNDCKYKHLELAKFFDHSKVFVCLTFDVWSYGECKYLALACHWIDEQYQRQTALLACKRSSRQAGKCLQTLNNNILLSYGLLKECIVNTVTGNIQDYTTDFIEFGINKEVLCMDSMDTGTIEDCTLHKQMQENIKLLHVNNEDVMNVIQLDVLRLNEIWGKEFTKYLDEETNLLHRTCMEKCCIIWQVCRGKQFKESFETILNAPLTPPNLFLLTSLYSSLKQLLLNKLQLSDICSFLKQPSFSAAELEYLEDLVNVFEPLHAAFEFLDLPQNHFYGCFLPTLVTLKWKLTRLLSSKKLKYLQDPLIKLEQQLLTQFKSYYELNDTKSEAIVAAITYPPIKTRFLKGLQDSVLCFNFQARNLLLKYGKDYHIPGENQTDNQAVLNNQQNSMDNITSATDFFDFGDGTEKSAEDSHLPNSLKLEIDAYLVDIDKTLMSLQKYPTIKRLFFRYNTCIPSPSTVLRLFPLHKILRNSLLNASTHEQFENSIFYQSHILDK